MNTAVAELESGLCPSPTLTTRNVGAPPASPPRPDCPLAPATAPPPLPPWLEDGQYRNWEIELAARFPLALSEMRWPSKPLETFDTQPLARWGIDIMTGWRPIMERLLEKLEAEIAAQPMEERDRFRILQIKEKFGRLTVYTADSTPDMDTAIQVAADESTRICEVCGAPGELKERNFWWAPRCMEHENWRPGERFE